MPTNSNLLNTLMVYLPLPTNEPERFSYVG
jgi:hypothetical protein